MITYVSVTGQVKEVMTFKFGYPELEAPMVLIKTEVGQAQLTSNRAPESDIKMQISHQAPIHIP